ncbi:S9 family peptidase [Aggregicoccus sp. 17bor-14]|uniref:S9 family peptidase n=1 Tax=Myxococcaceae TaxID=31 RepID=UPI00129CF56A|nr:MULTISPECIES: DPP IV N-terminal domain-containing protein [Myxococcaceae]MBF5041528.1 S9 family peptidase [Simulacricoccus sp. 17bor-14]MRI87313.1 S9 family peptidase [Aggregicoccus sp. 17bor-14]
MPSSLPTRSLLLMLMLLLAPLARAAEPADPLQARLDFAEKVFRSAQLVKDTVIPPQWLGDTDRFVYWSAVGEHAGSWVLVDARARTARPVLTHEALAAQLKALGQDLPLAVPFVPFTVTPDGKRLVFSLQGRPFALGLEGAAKVTALAPTDAAGLALRDGVAAPAGGAVAHPREEGFEVLDATGRSLVARPGEKDYAWQVPERGWSPDGRFLLVARSDARKVHKLPIVDYSSPLEQVEWVPYSKTGTPLARTELHVVEPATGRVTQVAAHPEETYDWVAGWRPDGKEALVLQLSRDGKRLDLVAVDPATGKSRLVLREERPQSFVAALEFAGDSPGARAGWATQVTPLPDNRHFLWMSERDGWRHVYLYDYAGKLERQVTRGAFPVHEVLGVGAGGQELLVLASAEAGAPYDRIPYRVRLAGGALERVAPEPGVHRLFPSPTGRFFVDGHSTRTVPRAWDLRAGDGRSVLRLAQADVSGFTQLGLQPLEGFTAKAADGATPLYGVLYKPRDFDPTKRYPVIDYIYAGPFLSIVPWSYVNNGMATEAHALAQLGFVVAVIDARGTPGRSKAFQDANYGRVGQTEIPDHVAALQQAAASRPYMDLARAGIYGHSWGGYFALRGMLTAPEFFKAGYAGAPGALEEEALINEPNLGLPSVNPKAYELGSNLRVAGQLRGALKLMHGTSDVNASLSTTMRMAQALIAAGKRFDLLVMPGEGHSPQGPAGRYYRDDVRRYFVEKLGPPQAAAASAQGQ